MRVRLLRSIRLNRSFSYRAIFWIACFRKSSLDFKQQAEGCWPRRSTKLDLSGVVGHPLSRSESDVWFCYIAMEKSPALRSLWTSGIAGGAGHLLSTSLTRHSGVMSFRSAPMFRPLTARSRSPQAFAARMPSARRRRPRPCPPADRPRQDYRNSGPPVFVLKRSEPA